MLKRLAHVNSNKIHAFKELSEEESNKILMNFNTINLYQRLNENYLAINKIYQEILNCIENNDQNLILSRLIKEFISSFLPFIDHWKKYLKNAFETLDNFELFEKAASVEYDSFFAYRFIYNLRNYLQHCSFPSISISKRILENGEMQCSLFLSKVELLSQYRKWQQQLKIDLAVQPDRIDLYPLIATVMESLHKLNYLAMNASLDVEKLFQSSKEIMVYEKFVENNEDQLAIIDYQVPPNSGVPINLSMYVFPFDLAQHLINNVIIAREY